MHRRSSTGSGSNKPDNKQSMPLIPSIPRRLATIVAAVAVLSGAFLKSDIRMLAQGGSTSSEPESMVTVAGSGAFVGDGEPGTEAGLNLVEGVAVDEGGSLWIADTGNSRIRKVDAVTGI